MSLQSVLSNGFTLRFVALSAESRALYEANTFQDAWASSLTLDLLEAPAPLDLNALIICLQTLLKSGFGGWIIAASAPQTITSFRVHAPAEGEAKDALLTITIGFKAMMPKELR